MSKYLLLLLILLPCAAFSQPISLPKPGPARLDGATVCLTLPVAARVRDSLTALPLVRREATQWRTAAGRYKQAADTVHSAYLAQVQAGRQVALALREQKIETTRQSLSAKQWKAKARRRGLLNWVGASLVTAALYGFFRP